MKHAPRIPQKKYSPETASYTRSNTLVTGYFSSLRPIIVFLTLIFAQLLQPQTTLAEPLCGKPYTGVSNGQDTVPTHPTLDWWNSAVGTDQIILPGYTPLHEESGKLLLHKREYNWGQSYLPRSITSHGTVLVKKMGLVAHFQGKPIELIPDKVTFHENDGYSVNVIATGEPIPGLTVETQTLVEYDGTAMTRVRLTPSQAIKLDSLDYIAAILNSPSMRVISFKADQIRRQKDRHDVLSLPYTGDFFNVVGMADGNRSFWWFADNAKGWIWNGASVTEISEESDTISLEQHIIGDTFTINKPLTFTLNFLVTPIRDLGDNWRSQRVILGSPSKKEQSLGGSFKIWWTSALAHDAFPYTYYPGDTKDLLSKADSTAYPGKETNRQTVVTGKHKFNAHWIPYFSAHTLSLLDPALRKHMPDWQVIPPVKFKGAAKPFTQSFGKPVLSHNARSYSNYVLSRLDDVITDLDISGIYLDHGPPFNSCNPKNGGWVDSNGLLQPSLDILGLRSFLKRLRVLFYKHGKPGYIFIHTSNREVIPAYSFAYATVNGEQYRNGRVKEGNYLDVVSLDEFRTRFAPDQYGLITLWLPIDWTYHRGELEWEGSETQRNAYRRMKGLALLHDVSDWPIGAHREERIGIIRTLESFGIGKASFIGYWNQEVPLISSDKDIKVSAYRRQDTGDYLFVAANISDEPVHTTLSLNTQFINPDAYHDYVIPEGQKPQRISTTNAQLGLKLNKKDFAIVILKAKKRPAHPEQ